MEVHAHTHTPRKKWTHYFWEFFMLFLAVTLGFFVENWREHYIERQRAKIFAGNLISDLKGDTTSLSAIIKGNKQLSNNLDSFNSVLLNDDVKEKNARLYYYATYSSKINFFTPNNATLEQLKSSGSLRYFPNDIVTSIANYDKALKDLDRDYLLQKSEYDKLSDLRFKLFNGNIAKQIFISIVNGSRDSIFKTNPRLVTDDPKLMMEFGGWVIWVSAVYESQTNDRLIPLKQQANDLISLLNKEY